MRKENIKLIDTINKRLEYQTVYYSMGTPLVSKVVITIKVQANDGQTLSVTNSFFNTYSKANAFLRGVISLIDAQFDYKISCSPNCN